MTLGEIATLLADSVDQQHGLRLDATMFPELASVLASAGVTQLQVSGTQVAPAPGAVTVDGQATLFGKRAGRVHLEVTGAQTVTAKLTFTAPTGWGFADGFPGLPPSYKHLAGNPGLVGLGPSVLYDLALASASLTATSGSKVLAFDGSLSDASALSFLAPALGLPAHPPLTGTLQLHDGAPAAPDLTIGGGSSTLPIGTLLSFDGVGLRVHTVAQDPAAGVALTRLELAATLEAGKTDPVPIGLTAPFHGLSGVLELTADFGEAGLSIERGVDAFAELLGLDAGHFALPKPLDRLGKFALQTIACVVNVDPPGVQRLVITVGPGRTWPIANGVEVDDLTIGWAIAFPFDADARSMSASLSGTLALGTVDPKLAFDILAGSDGGFNVSGELAHPMTLEQIATTVNGSPVSGLPDLEVVEAAISASTSGDFSVLVRLANWPIGKVGDTQIELYEVAAALGRQGGKPQGRFLTVLGVGKVRLYLSAELGMSSPRSGKNGGWLFKGGTVPGSPIPIGELLTELSETFGIEHVPAPIASLSLTALDLSYDTGSGEFTFTLQAGFTVASTPVGVGITIDVAPTASVTPTDPPATVTGTKGYSATFTGQVTFDKLEFDIVFDVADTGTDVLIADYVQGGGATDLQALVAEVAPSLAAAIPPGISVDLEEVKFVFLRKTDTRWAFGLRLGTEINLNELPIVGSKLPAGETLAVENLQLLYASAELSPEQTQIINKVMPTRVAKLPDTVGAGIAFDADVRLGSTQKHLHAGVTPPPALPAAARAPALPAPQTGPGPVPASSTDPVHWLDVDKQFGIFSFKRVGVGYQDNVLELALDASVALGPLAFSMQALTVGSPLTTFAPEFSLKGLALSFDRPPIDIGGAFLRVDEQVDGHKVSSYYGELIVQVTQFSLKALGGWAPDAHPASFFIYLNVDAPIGGPPFLFVTGLAGGFGINSALTLPTIDGVADYPLLPAKAPKEKASAAETIAKVIPALQKTFHPQAGEYWVAAGISFTSFEMIQAQAVVSVSFGVELEIGVVGTCAMTFPTGDPYPVAYVEIDVVASFTPSTGLLAVDGKLSPASFLFGGFVKLTGGFAFYAWFSGDHRGDFVVSLGGYHPAFDKPSDYPVVPRLQLAFSLGPLKVVGQAYFALVPSAFMAGLRLTATFASGPVKAWFDAGIDVLIAWAPFHYEAHAWVTIGCSVDLGLFTLKLQIGADLQIWGPAFGGTAVVDLDVVSFTIRFGAPKAPPPPVGWGTFAEKFLPQPERPAPHAVTMLAARAGPAAAPAPSKTNVLKASVTAGQLAAGPAGVDWILDPDRFRILTASTIPANHPLWSTGDDVTAELPNVVADYVRAPAPPTAASTGAPAGMRLQLDHDTKPASDTEVWEPVLNIAPMDQRNVASYLTVALRKYDTATGDYTDYVCGVTVAPQLAPSSTALWGVKPDRPDPNAKRLIAKSLTGLAITPVPRVPDAVSDVALLSLIYGGGHSTGFDYQQPAPDTRFTVTSSIDDAGDLTIAVGGAHSATLANSGYELSALTDDWVSAQRDAVLGELRQLGFATAAADDVDPKTMAATALTDWPSAALIGAQP